MKKLRYSIVAKCLAWLLCIVSAVGTGVLGLCLACGVYGGMWEMTREEALEDSYRYANMNYSVNAFSNRGSSAHAEELREEFFKYGIIKSNGLDGVNLHDKMSYLETNMTEQELVDLNPDELFLYLFVETVNGSRASKVMEYYGDYADIASLAVESSKLIEDSGWSYLYADRICYDVAEGVLYYRAEGNYYPVQNVSLCYDGSQGATVYNYNYDFNTGGYKLNFESFDTAIFDGGTDAFSDEGGGGRKCSRIRSG